MNLYAYVGNNPIKYVDPSGYAAQCGPQKTNPSGDGDLSSRGYKPKPGERSMTREQWKAQQRNQRLNERARLDHERATELNSSRRDWDAKNGTTAAIRGVNTKTGEVKTFIATESPRMPKEFQGKLRPGEEFIQGKGHAEETIINAKGDEWNLLDGGTSRNVCNDICKPKIEQSGMNLGGPKFPGRSDKSPYRMFWEE